MSDDARLDAIDAARAALDRRLIKLWAAYLRFIRIHIHTWRYQ